MYSLDNLQRRLVQLYRDALFLNAPSVGFSYALGRGNNPQEWKIGGRLDKKLSVSDLFDEYVELWLKNLQSHFWITAEQVCYVLIYYAALSAPCRTVPLCVCVCVCVCHVGPAFASQEVPRRPCAKTPSNTTD
eukprot:2062629-Pyramimonas_sp.AAC.2